MVGFFLSIILELKSALTSFQNINSPHQTCLGIASYSEFVRMLSQATDFPLSFPLEKRLSKSKLAKRQGVCSVRSNIVIIFLA